jgi:hypothetical protein
MGNSQNKVYSQAEYQFDQVADGPEILEYVKIIWHDLEKGYVSQTDPDKIFMLCCNGKSRVLYEAFAKLLRDNAPRMERNEYAKTVNAFIRIGFHVHRITSDEQLFPTLTEVAQYNSKFCRANMALDWERSTVMIGK